MWTAGPKSLTSTRRQTCQASHNHRRSVPLSGVARQTNQSVARIEGNNTTNAPTRIACIASSPEAQISNRKTRLIPLLEPIGNVLFACTHIFRSITKRARSPPILAAV